MKILKKIQEMQRDMTRWRHNLHKEPETAFQEKKTARFLTRQLTSFGMDEVHGMAGTGIVGVLHGKKGKTGKAIMLRSDMDALPLQEETGAPYASRNPGVHHACGHDGHMAMLLGAAKYLAETRDFDGTVYFVFQPAEEHIGGAAEMIKEGLFEKFPCDAVYGLHNYPGLPLGMMATTEGAMLAASDEFHVTLKGKGGHMIDTKDMTDLMIAAAEIISGARALAKKEITEETPAVMEICTLKADSRAANVLPEEVSFSGSIRSYDPALQKKLKDGLAELVQKVAGKYGAAMTIEFKNGYAAVMNAQAETSFAADVAREIVGDKNVITSVPKTMGVEDFSFFLQKKPGNFMAIGTGTGEPSSLHSAKYDFNDAALPLGASYWVRLVEKAMPLDMAKPTASAPPPPAPPSL